MTVLFRLKFRREYSGVQKRELTGFCLLGHVFSVCHQS